MKVYLDSSALVKRYCEEIGSDRVQETMDAASSVTASALCLLEVTSALKRRQRSRDIGTVEYEGTRSRFLEDLSRMELISFDESIFLGSLRLIEDLPLRTLDSIQLASALRAEPDLFVSADRALLEAAAHEGLEILDPTEPGCEA